MGWTRRLALAIPALAAAGAAAFWLITAPRKLDTATLAAMPAGDAVRGKHVFTAGGCASCHSRIGAAGDAALELAGGRELVTPFGTFVVPNISQDQQDGIGRWTAADLANAMLKGVSPDGRHYYPAFPYGSYARMKIADIADLSAYLKTLPAVAGRAPDHKLGFPFNIRRGLGAWKLLHLSPEPVVALAGASGPAALGRYLVEGPAHCGECHSPRDFSGGIKKGEWLAGAVAAEGRGNVPNITPSEAGIGSWSEADIVTLLETGFTPDFDSPGGAMADVLKNMAALTAEDRAAIAAYLKQVPPRPNGY